MTMLYVTLSTVTVEFKCDSITYNGQLTLTCNTEAVTLYNVNQFMVIEFKF